MKQLLNKIFNLGIENGQDYWTQNKIILLNQMNFIAFSFASIYTILYVIFGVLLLTIALLIGLALLLLTFWLNARGNFTLARILHQVSLIAILVFVGLNPLEVGAIYFFFATLGTLFATFRPKEWKIYAPIFVIKLFAILFLKFTSFEFETAVETHYFFTNYGDKLSISLAFLALAFVLFDFINENQKAENQLKEAKNKAEEASEAKSKFLSNISHELRTPLNAIQGLTKLMKKEDTQGINQENLKIIQQSSDQLLTLIKDILNLSKIEAGQIAFEKNLFDPHSILNDVKVSFQHKINNQAIKFITEADPNLPQILIGDKNRLIQVLNNLVSNAVKFTHNGYIKVTLKKGTESENTIYMEGIVEDTGIGIPDHKKEEIFQAFSQVDDQTSRTYEGSGLGLSITKELIEAQGGSLQLKSKEQEGTTFTFELPFEKQKGKTPSHQNEQSEEVFESDFQSAKVLIVEDNVINLQVAARILKKLNCEPHGAKDGKEALELIKQEAFDLIILDIHMPDMDGFEVAESIRSSTDSSYYQTIPIIAMSADAFLQTKEKAHKSGINDFIEKPVQISEVEKKLKPFTNKLNI